MKQYLMMMCMAGLLLGPGWVRAEDTPLAVEMQSLGKVMKSLRAETDPAKGAAAARTAQQAVLKATEILPPAVVKLADADAKAKAGAEYRLMLGQVFVAFCELEQAYLAKDLTKATAIMTDLNARKKAGHGRFMDDDED